MAIRYRRLQSLLGKLGAAVEGCVVVDLVAWMLQEMARSLSCVVFELVLVWSSDGALKGLFCRCCRWCDNSKFGKYNSRGVLGAVYFAGISAGVVCLVNTRCPARLRED